MAITLIDSKDELSELVEELNVHTDVKKDEVSNVRKCTSMKVIRNFKMFMKHCLRIMASMPKLLRVRSRK